jgi:NhaA family Na+:H+ antiporter
MNPKLVVEQVDESLAPSLPAGTAITVAASPYKIGRGMGNHLRIGHHEISRRHARIMFTEDYFFVEDLESRNGTLVNGVRLAPFAPRRLLDRDMIQLGAVLVVSFVDPDVTQRRENIQPLTGRGIWLDNRSQTAFMRSVQIRLPDQQFRLLALLYLRAGELVTRQDIAEALWSTDLGISFGDVTIVEDLQHWVNDGLMALFFLVVGLEIKRELTTGELRDPRAAALPVVAALGGMVVPALLYLALNAGGAGESGWGIPMATDIAFALGVLTLAARSAPASLKPFLLTLAIVDDIGAITVIAIFYTDDVNATALLIAVGLLALIVLLQRIDVRWAAVYIGLGVAVWVAVYESGVHPTIAGVALGLLTPSVPFQRPQAVSREAHRVADETMDDPSPPDSDAGQWLELARLSREAVSPLARVEAALHPWTSSLVIPLFALANAGVVLSTDSLADAVTSPVTLGIVLGLVVGKVVGIAGATWLSARTGLGRLPEGAGWAHLVGVSAVAGIGFTVSLFISELAFPVGPLEDLAKVGIFAASLLAGALGFVLFRRLPPAGSPRP